jgi:hypothetical protein
MLRAVSALSCLANEGVEEASRDVAPVMQVLQDRDIEKLWESMLYCVPVKESVRHTS